MQAFFNQMSAQVANAAEFKSREGFGHLTLDDFLVFADGTHVDAAALQYAKELCEETAVEIEWQQGDAVLLDNYAVMHARRVFEGPRRVLASLVQ